MDKTALAEAANYLIEASDYTSLIRDVSLVIRDWDNRHVTYVGEKACLNELVKLGLDDLSKFQRVVELIESRRTGPRLKRTEYQAEYMAQRRARLAKAYQIEALVRGKPLSPDEKRASEKRTHAAWSARKEAFIEEQGAVSWDDKLAATTLFWEMIDKELDEQLAAAQAAPVVKRNIKRVVKVEVSPRTEFGKRIREAMNR